MPKQDFPENQRINIYGTDSLVALKGSDPMARELIVGLSLLEARRDRSMLQLRKAEVTRESYAFTRLVHRLRRLPSSIVGGKTIDSCDDLI